MTKTTKTKKLKQPTATTKKPGKKIRKRDLNFSKRAGKNNKPATNVLESDSEIDADELTALLEPYSKDQLINLISSAAVKNSSLCEHISNAADRDISHRKIFVHGLSWDTTLESLKSTFLSFGEIEECKLVTDKLTGKAKGFAFIVFKTRKSAQKALKNPQKKINNRIASCQLASVGPTAPPAQQGKNHNQNQSLNQNGVGERKIYVSNVQRDVDKEKLKGFFERFGEIETGPFGFDVNTGKSRGFAIFVYKSVERAKKALAEPYKIFQGHQLHCQKAADGKNKTQSKAHSTLPGQQMMQGHHQVQGQGQGQDQSQVLAAMAAAQNLALFGQHPGLNPVYGGLLANSGLINPMVAGALNQGVVPSSHMPVDVMGGLGAGSSSVLGSYGSGQILQHVYPNAQGRTQGTGGSFPGYTSSYM